MFCNACGCPNPDGSLFCSKCGEPMSAAATAVPPGMARGSAVSSTDSGANATYRTDAKENDAFDEEAYAAVIGPKNQAYYLKRFATMNANGGGVHLSWHWPAFFVTWYWLMYRKMWGWSLLYFCIPTIVAFIVGFALGSLEVAMGRQLSGLPWLLVSIPLAVLVPPTMANWLYYHHCTKLMRAERIGASRERHLARLEAKGGTNKVVAVIFVIVVLIWVIGILAAIGLPAYQEYTKRAKISEAIVSGMAIAQLVGDQYERTGKLSLDSLVGKSALSKYVTNMEINPQTGIIQIQTSVGPSGAAGSIFLVPHEDAAHHVSWTCKSAPEMTKFVPSYCRG